MEGIHRLVDAVSELGTVIVAAPDGPRSGGSSAISCNTMLMPKRIDDYNGAQMWSVNGTPADCVKLALNAIVDKQPDLVLAGINHGSNTGNSVIYSGTMGAVIEGCLQGIPSIGFSVCTHNPSAADFDACMPHVTEITRRVIERGLPDGVCLNVNFPKGGVVKGFRRARACRGRWTEEYAHYTSPEGKIRKPRTRSHRHRPLLERPRLRLCCPRNPRPRLLRPARHHERIAPTLVYQLRQQKNGWFPNLEIIH